jgi:Putative Actinobacterial Holin-X, holin superfamily III
VPSEKSIASVIAETKEELKTFVQTRAELLRAETREKLQSWKRSIVLLAVAALFLLTAWIALVFSVVALLRSWIVSGDYSWCFGGLIVGGILAICGVVLARSGYQGIKAAGMTPSRTLRILKKDQEWLQNQSRPA